MEPEPKPDEEKKEPPGEELKRQEIDFFDELPIFLNMDEYNEGRKEAEQIPSFTVFMRPLIVEELQVLNRVTYLQEKNKECEQAAFILVRLMVETLSVSGEEVPVEATGGLVAKMIEYNFPPDMTKPDKEVKKKDPTGKDGLIDCFDFLITHGHSYSEILLYPVPVFNNFIIVISERLGIKKKPEDAAAAFRKLGLPITKRGDPEIIKIENGCVWVSRHVGEHFCVFFN